MMSISREYLGHPRKKGHLNDLGVSGKIAQRKSYLVEDLRDQWEVTGRWDRM